MAVEGDVAAANADLMAIGDTVDTADADLTNKVETTVKYSGM